MTAMTAMTAKTPEDCDRLFAECANRGDLESLVALYEPDAGFVPREGSAVNGTAAIREALGGLLAMKPHLTMKVTKTVRAGADLAVLYNDWSMTATGPDGKPAEATGKAIEIVRRQPDGTWRFALDDPFARG
jgi:uncharacterized protein (TIGR02246 family)